MPFAIEGTPGAGNVHRAMRIIVDICIIVRNVSGFDLFDG